MQKTSTNPEPVIAGRITSVDFFRGLTMFLLIGESTELYSHFRSIEGSSIMQFFAAQFDHHEWHGLNFWDLIQPFFMFIVGVAIPFAVANRIKKGDSYQTILKHAFKRSGVLLFLGWALYCTGPGEIVFRFQNVLAQLSVTYLVAFLIFKKSFSFQIIFTLVVLLLTDLAYRYFPVEGFNHPWVPFENFGAWSNNKIEGVEKADIWASINAFPTIAHTVWGVLCGKLLMSARPARFSFRTLPDVSSEKRMAYDSLMIFTGNANAKLALRSPSRASRSWRSPPRSSSRTPRSGSATRSACSVTASAPTTTPMRSGRRCSCPSPASGP